MKLFSGILFSCAVLFFLGCSNNPNPIFVMETQAEFEIPAGHNTTFTHVYRVQNIPTFFEIYNGGIDTSAILHLYPNSAVLRPKFDEFDLDFINSVNVFLLDPLNPTDEIELFFMDFVQLGSKVEIQLFNTIRDVEQYMSLENFHIDIEINYRQTTFRTEPFILEMTFAAYDEE